MNRRTKLLVFALLIVAVIVAARMGDKKGNNHASGTMPSTHSTVALPKMVEIGADKCIPCKAMFPVLEALRKEYPGKLEVDFVDVWKNPDQKERYSIRVIPTQVLYNAEGKEIFRHEGFFAKDEILAKFAELGVKL